MNYFYDFLINLNDNNIYNFYEWDNKDPIELVKKIPIFRIDTKTMNDLLLFNVVVDKNFLDSIYEKTILRNNKINNSLEYACLFNDTKSSVVLEFNESGEIISRSFLQLEDDANVLELVYNLKTVKINYEKKYKIKVYNGLRHEMLMKRIIKLEFDTLIANKNQSKLNFLFNEWFGYEEQDICKLKEKIVKKLFNDKDENYIAIYNIIMLSYNK